MPNLFEKRMEELNISQRGMATRLDVSNTAISNIVNEKWVPTTPIADLAKAFEITEQQASDEVMAIRRRIEKREAKIATPAK